MKYVICQFGETEPGTTTVALTRDDTTIVIRDVSAQICTTWARNMWIQKRAGGCLRLQNKRCMKGYRWTYGAIKPHRLLNSGRLIVLIT